VFTILGVVVDASGITDPNFKNLADSAIGRAAFFASSPRCRRPAARP
jgi:hypothetical protein